MKRERYFMVAGILGMLFGLGFLLMPDASLRTYGMPTDPHNLLQSRYFGSALLTVGLVYFVAADTQEPKAIRALLVAGLVGNLVGAVISASAAGSLQNGMAWSSVAIYGALAACAAYFLFFTRTKLEATSVDQHANHSPSG